MDADEPRPADPLALLAKQDLDPLSVADLEERIARLEAEVERSRARLAGATRFKASADALFRRPSG
jgi:uncharacterized small protein (DUF1192 family)